MALFLQQGESVFHFIHVTKSDVLVFKSLLAYILMSKLIHLEQAVVSGLASNFLRK